MGCNSDYMQQSRREALLQETAQLYLGALKILGLNASEELIDANKTKMHFICLSLMGIPKKPLS